MQLPITMHMAQKHAVSRDNPEDVFTFLYKNFGCSRKVYNLCVDSLYRQLEAAGYLSGDDIPDTVSPKVSILKKEYPYLKEADAQGLSNSVMDFLSAWKRFLKQPSHRSYTKRALRRDSSGTEPLSFRGLKGIPKFHAKAQGYSSYRTACQYPSGKNGLKQPTVRLEKDTLYLPKLKGGVRLVLHRSLPEDAHIENVTLSMDTDRVIHASICYSYTLLVDMTLQEAAMDRTFPEGITFLGLDYSQQDFYVDNGFGMFRSMLAYKLRRKGSCLVKVDRWFPSSKTCSCCGHVLESLELTDRTYTCPACGKVIGRDENAAINICREGKRLFPGYLKELILEEQKAAGKTKRKGRLKIHGTINPTGRDAGDSLYIYGENGHTIPENVTR